MKILLAILIILLLLACGNTGDKTSKTTSENSIIGTPIRLGNIEIAEKDFPDPLTWDAAKATCTTLGSGWRLPTKDELNNMYLNKKIIGIGMIPRCNYWTSTEVVPPIINNKYDIGMYFWTQNSCMGKQDISHKSGIICVRAVRNY